MKRIASAFFMLALASALSFAQTVSLAYSGSGSYSLVERTNLRRYENGRYVGLSNREVRSFITPDSDGVYDGNFYVVEKTLRDHSSAFAGIYDSIPAKFRLGPDGRMEMREDNGYPTFRSFPSFPAQRVKPGDTWAARAERSVDPLNRGVFTRLQIEVSYRFVGEEVYNGQSVYRISAMWQTNYGMNWKDPNGDPDLRKARGGHKAEILVLKSNGSPLLVVDNVDESFTFADGTTSELKGRISLFIESPPAVDRGKLLPALGEIAKVSETFADELALDSPGFGGGSAGGADGGSGAGGGAGDGSGLGGGSDGGSGIAGGGDDDRIERNLAVLEGLERSRADLTPRDPRLTDGGDGIASNGAGGTGGNGSGGNGGSDGSGGNGGRGGDGIASNGSGGSGGSGGNGGRGGDGIASNGSGGSSGSGGSGGDDGKQRPSRDELIAMLGGTGGADGRDSSQGRNSSRGQGSSEGRNASGGRNPSDGGGSGSGGGKGGKKGGRGGKDGGVASGGTGSGDGGSGGSGSEEQPKNNMVVEETNAGIRLSVRNLQFRADSSELLGGERSRLDEIARVLALVPGGRFLVEGHTASVGDVEDEQALSEERAKVVAVELAKRGVSADSFICRGWGGTKPVAPNTSEKGKAQNRRVEITILE